MTAPDVLTVLRRADQRWATNHGDDPAQADYLQHLATALDQAARQMVERDTAELRADTRKALDAATQARDTAVQQLRDLQHQQPALDELRAQLGRLVDAINEEWHPDRDPAPQVDRAIDLVHAANATLDELDAKQHIHRFPHDPDTGQIKSCACGKRFPKTTHGGLTARRKGAA